MCEVGPFLFGQTWLGIGGGVSAFTSLAPSKSGSCKIVASSTRFILHIGHHAYLQERQSTSRLDLSTDLQRKEPQLTAPPTDPARAQKGRQGGHPRTSKGQRAASQSPEADVDCMFSLACYSIHVQPVLRQQVA
jgi:hypothetical protein